MFLAHTLYARTLCTKCVQRNISLMKITDVSNRPNTQILFNSRRYTSTFNTTPSPSHVLFYPITYIISLNCEKKNDFKTEKISHITFKYWNVMCINYLRLIKNKKKKRERIKKESKMKPIIPTSFFRTKYVTETKNYSNGSKNK